MKTVVNKQAKPYSQIKNSWITDINISDTGYRLLCYIEMQSENWVFYKEEIKKRFGRGEDKYTGAMQSIKKAGYIDHYPVKNDKGAVTHRAIDLYDEPAMVGDSHTPGNPPYGNPPQYNNTNSNNTNNNKNKEKERKQTPFVPPTLEEVINYFIERGYKKSVAERAFECYNVADRYDTKGNKIKVWKQKMNTVWFKDENKAPKEIPKDNSHIPNIYDLSHLQCNI